MKFEYLQKLRELLDRYEMEETEKEDILNDYEDMYENWLDYGMDDEEVQQKLGKPRSIIGSLTEGYRKLPKPQSKSSKVIAIMPFIATILFFIGGFFYDGWAWSWMAYLLIPVVAITTEMGKSKDPHITTALSPFVAVVAFFVLGFFYDLWHIAWAVFLIIPILGIFNSRKGMKPLELLTALSPFAAVLIYGYFGFIENNWHPTWLVFLIIPMIGLLNEKNKVKVFIAEFLLLAGIGGYLYLGYTFTDFWGYGAVAFLPAVLYLMYTGHIQITSKDTPKEYKILIIITLLVYLVLSFLTQYWELTWLVFFSIPLYAIYKETSGSERVIAFTPFIATTIFMLVGVLLGGWVYAWVAFLLIPVTAILKS